MSSYFSLASFDESSPSSGFAMFLVVYDRLARKRQKADTDCCDRAPQIVKAMPCLRLEATSYVTIVRAGTRSQV